MATTTGIDNFDRLSISDISVDSNNNWSEGSEALIRNYIKQCSGYCTMYDKMRISYKKTSDYINLTNGIIGAVITSLGLITVGNNHLSMAITITTIVLGVVVSVNSVLKSVWNLDKLQTQLVAAHYDYTKLCNNMRAQLALGRDKRTEATRYLNIIRGKLEYCIYNHPAVDGKIMRQYINRYGNMFDVNDMEQQANDVARQIENVRKSQHEIAIMTKQRSVQPPTPTFQVMLPTINSSPTPSINEHVIISQKVKHSDHVMYIDDNDSQPSVLL
jgi:hypothetical protein